MGSADICDADKTARDRIVNGTDRNFFVEAGAGSGKTTMLVNRMVSMIEHGMEINKICAITFTKAAAGEFYERFQNKLTERSRFDPEWKDTGRAGQLGKPTPETAKRCAEALKNIDLCFMGTIDSFCNMILSEHPTEAGIPSDSSVISDEDAETAYKQIYVKICEGKYGQKLADLSGMFRAIHRNPEDVFVKGMSFFMDHRNAEFPEDEPLTSSDPDIEFACVKKDIVDALEFLLNHPELKYDKSKESVAAWDELENNLRSLKRNWSRNFTGVLYSLNKISKLRTIPGAASCGSVITNVFVPGGAKGNWLEPDGSFSSSLADKLDGMQYRTSVVFLKDCITVVEDQLREKGNLSYFDYLYYLRNMLKKDAEGDGKLIKYIYDRHSYFLIDEFQDTNPMQAEVFFYLTAEEPVPAWTQCRPKQGSLFIVGDPKQSIYRFRSADVTSFLNVRKLFEDGVGDVLKLTRNFRSRNGLLDYFNKTFTALLPADNEYQSRFDTIPVPDGGREAGVMEGTYSYIAYTGKKLEEYPDQSDPLVIGRIISTITDNEKYLIRTPKDLKPRKIRYSDIMVITSAKKNLDPIMKRLDELNIPTKVEGSVPFAENEALAELSSIYSAIADTDNKIALYAALTGKIFGASEDDLINYVNDGGRITLKIEPNLNEGASDKSARIAKMLVSLRDLRQVSDDKSPAAIFDIIMDVFRIFEKVSPENLEVLYYALELLRAAESKGEVASAAEGAAFIEDLHNGLSGEERCLSLADNRDCVHLANLHKVKGLEAPVVILAAAGQKTNFSGDYRIEYRPEGTKGYLFRLGMEGSSKGSYFKTSEYPEEAEEEKIALSEEEKRHVYVAATRAANVLIVYNVDSGRQAKWKDLSAEVPDISAVISELSDERITKKEITAASDLYEKAESVSIFADRSSEKETYLGENPSRLKLAPKIKEEEIVVSSLEDTETDAEGLDTDKNSGAEDTASATSGLHSPLFGTMIHRLMEVMVSSGNKGKAEDLAAGILSEYQTEDDDAELLERYRKALIEVAETIRGGGYPQKNNVPQDILSELLSSEECHTEVPFCYMDETADSPTVINGIMDVIYRKAGEWHIVDYKTNADGNALDVKYQNQLEAYKKAFEKITGEKVKDAGIYHIT